jgi:hypothetical protein
MITKAQFSMLRTDDIWDEEEDVFLRIIIYGFYGRLHLAIPIDCFLLPFDL